MNKSSQEVPLKFFNLIGSSELRASRLVIGFIAVTVVLTVVIALLIKLLGDMQQTVRTLESERVMYGFPNSEGVFVSSKQIPDAHIKGFISVFTDNFFNYTPESVESNATEALRMMSTRLRSLQEDKLRTVAKSVYEQQITQVFSKTAEYKVEQWKDYGYIVSFPAKRHRVVLNDVFSKSSYVVKILIKPVKPSKHFEWAIVVDDFQIEEIQ
jgi:hypothetical protein